MRTRSFECTHISYSVSCLCRFLIHHTRSYPYLNQKHNTLDTIGHCILILTYTVSLVLRSSNEFEHETFPREGYGLFIVFLYVFVLPAPVVYYYLRDSGDVDAATKLLDGDPDGREFENPLDVDTGADAGFDASPITARVPPSALAKLRRDANEARAEVATLRQALFQAEANATANSSNVEQAGLPNSIHNRSTKKETAGEVTLPSPDLPPPIKLNNWDVRRPSQVAAMQGLVEEGIISAAVHAGAKKSYEQHITAEIEAQDAAGAAWQAIGMMRQQNEVAFADRAGFFKWLVQEDRLARHERKLATILGRDTVATDLLLIDDDDMAELSSVMTKLEAKRFSAAVDTLKRTGMGAADGE